MKYQSAGVPLIILAGKNYGTGSPRDWVAKGQAMLVCTVNIYTCTITVSLSLSRLLVSWAIFPFSLVASSIFDVHLHV